MSWKPDNDSLRGRLTQALIARLARFLVTVISITLKVEIRGRRHLDALREAGQPVIVSFWHEGVVLSVRFLVRRMHQAGIPLALLASQSRDGEIVARMAESWQLAVVRGSSTRGGSRALRGLRRVITQQGASPIIAPDGPRGPQYHFKPGTLVMSQISGAPILPIGFACDRCWNLRSWDRLIIPKPFSRMVIVVGKPEPVEPRLNDEEREAERQRLEAVLDAVNAEAQAALRS